MGMVELSWKPKKVLVGGRGIIVIFVTICNKFKRHNIYMVTYEEVLTN